MKRNLWKLAGDWAKSRKGGEFSKTRQNNKSANRKTESNDSPEIPDRGETSEEPGLPAGQNNGRD